MTSFLRVGSWFPGSPTKTSQATGLQTANGEIDSELLRQTACREASAGTDSAAARLQRQHEMAQKSQAPSPDRTRAPVPPSPFDFPDLSVPTKRRDTETRKPSYAAMAVHGVLDALDREFPGPQKRNGSDITSDGCTGATQSSYAAAPSEAGTAASSFDENQQTQNDTDFGEESVIITPTLRSPTSPGKLAPRFTQPTQASLRKESVSPATKTTSDGSPTKSARNLTKQQQKRKSIPGGWMNNSGPSSSETSPIKESAPGRAESSKRSSFMAPTKATTRREIATLGQETIKRTSPRIQKSLPRLNTTVGTIKSPSNLTPTTPSTAASDQVVSVNRAEATSRMAQAQAVPHLARRSTVSSPAVDVLSAQANAAGLPSVPNTTAKRRGSHGHLLLPIKAKLDKYGLWNENRQPTVSEEVEPQPSSSTITASAVPRAQPETPVNQPTAPTATTSEPADMRTKFMPPHVLYQHRMTSRTGSAATVTPASNVRSSQTPSLRATAAEFMPMAQPVALESELREYDRSGVLAFRSTEEWVNLAVEDRQAIARVREMNRARASSATMTMSAASPFRGVSRAANRRYWDGIAAQQRERDHDSPTRVQPGQVLRPDVHPETGVVRWIIEDSNGNKGPIEFGRAPPPTFGSPSTPSISPTSDDSSPRRLKDDTPRGWAIGSLNARDVYGWTGGDGKEIKFQGWGPDAERDPNNPVNFSFQSRPSGNGHGDMGIGPRMIGGSENDNENSAPLAPRSRRQWAEKLECPQIPCGTIDIVEAGEVPFIQQPVPGSKWEAINVSGYCFACTAPPVAPV